MDIHPNIVDLSPLVGTFTGVGHGQYPTIRDFDYREEVSFSHVGKPFLAYQQRTFSLDGAPMHSETGYLRVIGEGRVEMVVAMPTGHAELSVGTSRLDDDHLVIEVAGPVCSTPTSKDVQTISRSLKLIGDELCYVLAMQAVGHASHQHLRAVLTRR